MCCNNAYYYTLHYKYRLYGLVTICCITTMNHMIVNNYHKCYHYKIGWGGLAGMGWVEWAVWIGLIGRVGVGWRGVGWVERGYHISRARPANSAIKSRRNVALNMNHNHTLQTCWATASWPAHESTKRFGSRPDSNDIRQFRSQSMTAAIPFTFYDRAEFNPNLMQFMFVRFRLVAYSCDFT